MATAVTVRISPELVEELLDWYPCEAIKLVQADDGSWQLLVTTDLASAVGAEQ